MEAFPGALRQAAASGWGPALAIKACPGPVHGGRGDVWACKSQTARGRATRRLLLVSAQGRVGQVESRDTLESVCWTVSLWKNNPAWGRAGAVVCGPTPRGSRRSRGVGVVHRRAAPTSRDVINGPT
ncbi:hypothetical protein SKAU_G00198870 [Synaphobranchus kaupii]|uniref:Uncharacterized protein n=1 Tax=Synaphobranchus kaupii TaxID=118154 RepID=A0A9Q1FEZ9_SYNKA|nr:hypothetical protein SKAU_G00198870 [Synaphobranchus kaupii]